MDLTPPSLTTSPSSPHRKSVSSPSPYLQCLPEPSTVSYSPLPFLDHSFIPPPYGSMDHASMSQPMSVDSPMTSLEHLPHEVPWGTPSIAASASPATTSSSIMPSVVPAEYEHFASYETSCLPPYSANNNNSNNHFQRHSSTHPPPAFHPTPPPSTADARPSPLPQRNSFAFAPQDSLPSKPRPSSFANYNPPSSGAHYSPVPPTRAMSVSNYTTSGRHFSAHPQVYMGEMPSQAQPAAQQQMPPRTQPEATLTDASARAAWSRLKRKRKVTRRHTTKEEANYQCQVEGCGKFFSRSYNYKSHMETHDEKREYPFPCQMTGCTKKFVRKTDLQRHHQSVHTKERNHKCDFCGRMFARKDTLRR